MIEEEKSEEFKMSQAREYLGYLKMNNKKEFNKLRKRVRKFSDTIMTKLK